VLTTDPRRPARPCSTRAENLFIEAALIEGIVEVVVVAVVVVLVIEVIVVVVVVVAAVVILKVGSSSRRHRSSERDHPASVVMDGA
jgi:hypothetical protein